MLIYFHWDWLNYCINKRYFDIKLKTCQKQLDLVRTSYMKYLYIYIKISLFCCGTPCIVLYKILFLADKQNAFRPKHVQLEINFNFPTETKISSELATGSLAT